MALIGYTITVVAKQDNPYNVLPETDISIRKNSDNTLVNIYADEAGLIPIAQLGAKTDSNGQFTFYADASLGVLKAVWTNGGVIATEVLDQNDHSRLVNRNAVGAHDAIYRRETTVAEIATGVFSVGDKLTVTDRGGAKAVVEAGTANGSSKLNAENGNVARIENYVEIDLSHYIPNTSDKNFDATSHFTQAILDSASVGGVIFLPPDLIFKSDTINLNKDTADKILITTKRPAVYNDSSGGTIWTTSDRLFNVGVDDGNPDTTGFTRSVTLYGVQIGRDLQGTIASDTSDVAVNVVNTAQFTIEKCRTFGFKQGGVRLEGGLVIVRHVDTESFGFTGKDESTGYGSGIVMGQKYWGTFDLKIIRPHIFQYKYAFDLMRGRKFVIDNPTVENLQHSAFRFSGAEEIYSLSIDNTYSELVREYTFFSDGFTGLIYKLNHTNSEIHECPPYSPKLSNMDRARVLRYSETGNIYMDSALDAQLGTTTSGRLTDTRIFTSGTVINRLNYNDELHDAVANLKQKEILLTAGTFGALNGSYPYGWSSFGSSTAWTSKSAPVNSGGSLESGGGDWTHAQKGVVKDPVAKLYAVAVTHKGELTLSADGSVVYQSNQAEWHTEVVRFQSLANSTLLLTVGPITDINAKVNIAEISLWEIGAADYTEVGATSGLLYAAVRLALREGYY